MRHVCSRQRLTALSSVGIARSACTEQVPVTPSRHTSRLFTPVETLRDPHLERGDRPSRACRGRDGLPYQRSISMLRFARWRLKAITPNFNATDRRVGRFFVRLRACLPVCVIQTSQSVFHLVSGWATALLRDEFCSMGNRLTSSAGEILKRAYIEE